MHWGVALGLLLVLLQLLILAQGLRMSLACHCYCKTYLSALPTRANHDCLQAILRFPTRTFLRRRYATWRRDVAAPLLAMMFFRAMSYCANLRKWKLPVLAYLRGHQLVLPRECVLREGDSGGLWCIGAPRFTARPGHSLGLWGFCLCCCNYLSWRRDFACPLLAIVIVKRICPHCRRKRITTACKRFYGFRLGLFFAVAT